MGNQKNSQRNGQILPPERRKIVYASLGIIFGGVTGMIFGNISGNLSLGLIFGALTGLIIGSLIDHHRKKNRESIQK